MYDLPRTLPETGIGDEEAVSLLRRRLSECAADLGGPEALAHMDPPAAAVSASLSAAVAFANENLLHASTSPFASSAERLVLDWILPIFSMGWGQMCSGSTVANLTALWAAREAGATDVVASADAHISIAKAAHILGMGHHAVRVDDEGRLVRAELPDLRSAALVLTAGTTGRGAIDDLGPVAARWLHVDAAWAGPLRMTRFAHRLDGVEHADSVAISAHKWLYQPKGAALILFKERSAADAITFGSSYLARPNVGIEGTRSATAVLLLATLLAWGRRGLADRIERSMALADELAQRLDSDPRADLRQRPQTGVINWRPRNGDAERAAAALVGTSSSVMIDGQLWLRQVPANPGADLERIWERIAGVLG